MSGAGIGAETVGEAIERVSKLDVANVTVSELKTAMGGCVDESIETFMSKFGTSYKANPLRQAYESEVNGLADIANTLKSQGKNPEEIARTVSQARRDLGVKYKNATPPTLRDFIYERNMATYNGDQLGPTFDWLMNKYNGNFDDIISAGCRPNPNVDTLLGGFKTWLNGKLQ